MRWILSFCLFLRLTLCWANPAVHIGVSSSMEAPLVSICQKFSQATGYLCKTTVAPTGHLYAHIMHGMAYDLILSSDETYTQGLINAQKAEPESREVVAVGRIVLWGLAPDTTASTLYETLMEKDYVSLAIANPGASPYGLAAKEVLQHYNLWSNIQGRLIYGKNIKHAHQLIVNRQVALGFVSLAQLSCQAREQKQYWEPSPDSYKPVLYEVVVLKTAKHREAILAFKDFLQNEESCQILSQAGYRCPKRIA